MADIKYPPLLLKYLKTFQDDPRKSRIFAPLAEAYRKIGLVDQAIDICREGPCRTSRFRRRARSRSRAPISTRKCISSGARHAGPGDR